MPPSSSPCCSRIAISAPDIDLVPVEVELVPPPPDLDLTAADLSGATFALCELRRCEMQGIRGIEALSGARVPLADLLPITPLLADALGIIPTE